MPKRFVDTELHDKEWFMALPCRLKCAVRYLFDKCDNAGVWIPNYKLASIYVGESFSEEEILQIDEGGQFQKFGEKILITDFIDFQYGELSEKCNPHKPVIKKLIKYGLWENGNLRLPNRVPDTLKEKEKDKDKEKDKEKEKEMPENSIFSEQQLIPSLYKIFVEKNTGYLKNDKDDYTALNKILKYLCDLLGEDKNIIFQNTTAHHALKLRWGEIVSFIVSDSFYQSFDLPGIQRNFRAILLRQKNESEKQVPEKVYTPKMDQTLNTW